MARLPCLATGTPQAAATRETAVEMLKVEAPSPPVPQVSIRPVAFGDILVAAARMAAAAPATTSALSPRMESPIRMAAIWAGVASPFMMAEKTVSVVSPLMLPPA